MKAYQFPMACPACGVTIVSPPEALANHRNCHQQVRRWMEHVNDMVELARNWPEPGGIVTWQERERREAAGRGVLGRAVAAGGLSG